MLLLVPLVPPQRPLQGAAFVLVVRRHSPPSFIDHGRRASHAKLFHQGQQLRTPLRVCVVVLHESISHLLRRGGRRLGRDGTHVVLVLVQRTRQQHVKVVVLV